MSDDVELLAQELNESTSSGRTVNGTIIERDGTVVKVDIGGQTLDAYSPPAAGLVVGNTVQVAVQEGTAAVSAVIDGPMGAVPIGGTMGFYGDTAPPGWLICNGATFSATAYPALYAHLGTNVLPDSRDRVPMGASATKDVKSTGGSFSITQTVAQMPSHNHDISVDNTTLLYPATGLSASIVYPVVNGAETTYTGGGDPMDITPRYIARHEIIYAGAPAA